MNNRSTDYMFREHSPDELLAWTKRLDFFRYMRAAGGIANDGDTLLACIKVEKSTLPSSILKILGFPLLPADALLIDQRPTKMDSVLMEKGLRSNILPKKFLFFEGQEGFIWLSICGASGDRYKVTEADVTFAEEVEQKLKTLLISFEIPPYKSMACFSEKNYPEYFQGS